MLARPCADRGQAASAAPAGARARAGLSRLRDLNLQACRNIVTAPGQGLPGLAGLTALTALNLRGCDNLADGALLPLAALTALQALDLSGCQKLTGAGCARGKPVTLPHAYRAAGARPQRPPEADRRGVRARSPRLLQASLK